MRFLKEISRPDRNNKLRILTLVLAVLCIAQGLFIFYYIVHKCTIEHKNLDDFSAFMQDKFQDDKKNNWGHFDDFFDNDFFKKEQDPFAEMERFHKETKRMMEEDLGDYFDHSWTSWFGSRFHEENNHINVVTTETKDDYIITLVLENLEDSDLNIDIEDGKISVKGTYTNILERKDRDGQILSRQERRQYISNVFPIPEDADYSKADIVKKEDKIIITIPKKI